MIDTPDVIDPIGNFYWGTIGTLTAALICGILCAIVVVMLPQRIRFARNTIATVPANAAMVGGFSFLAVGALSIIYGISLILILPVLLLPAAFGIWLGTIGLFLGGVVVVAEPFGQWLLRKCGIFAAPMAAAAVGGFVLMLGTLVLGTLPVFGWLATLAGLIIVAMGAGGLILTHLGTRAYPETIIAGDSPSVRLV